MKKSPGRVTAEKIAARTGETVKSITVKMVGSTAVTNLLTRIQKAQLISHRPFLLSVVSFAYDSVRGHFRKQPVVWYRNQWRKIINFEIIEEAGYNFQNRPKAGWVTFEGLSKPRKMHEGISLFTTFAEDVVLRGIADGDYWLQPNGPKLPELLKTDTRMERVYARVQV